MDGTQAVVALLGAGGLGAALLALVNGLIKWLNGSYGRQRSRSADLVVQRNDAYARAVEAEERAEGEALHRRRLAEYASELRRLLIEAGHDPRDLPPFPSREG